MKKISLLLLAALLAGLFSPPSVLRADTVTLKDGTRYEGEPMGEDGTTLFFNAGGDILRIPKGDIQSVAKSLSPLRPPPQAAPESPESAEPSTTPQAQKATDGPVPEEMQKLAQSQMKQLEGILKNPEAAKTYMDQMQKFIDMIMSVPAFRWVLALAYETRAKARLRELFTRAMVYTMEHESPPGDLRALAADGTLDPGFTKPDFDGYKYGIRHSSEDFEVTAVPVNPASGLKGFTVYSKNGSMEETGGTGPDQKSKDLLEKALSRI